MISRGSGASNQALYSLWSSGFLPSKHQGVNLRSGKEPVLYLKDPEGIDRDLRRRMLDGISKINQEQFEEFGDPETQTRISQYEMAFRMQSSVPELMDVTKEPKSVTDLYGRTPNAQAPLLETASSPAAWPSVAYRSSTSSTADGITTADYPVNFRNSARISINQLLP